MSVWESKGRSTIGARCLLGGRTVVYRSDARHSVRARSGGPLGLRVYESRFALPVWGSQRAGKAHKAVSGLSGLTKGQAE